MENITVAARNKMALMYGFMVGIIYIVLISATNIFVGNMIVYYAVKFVAYVLYFVLIGIFLTRIRKANGGYMNFKGVFSALFIMVLIAGIMTYLYNYLYINVIDKEFMNKIRTSTINFMEKMKTPEDKIDEAVSKFDKQVAKSKDFHINDMLLTFLGGLVLDCLFGLIVSLIVKKDKPVFDTWA